MVFRCFFEMTCAMRAKQLSLLAEDSQLGLLPTAKIKAKDKLGVHGWTKFYASFSEEFVNKSIDAMGLQDDSVILDPFVGSGTTLVSCLKKGLPAIGVDLDPFACLLSRCKVALDFDKDKVRQILNSPRSVYSDDVDFCEETYRFFSESCIDYAAKVIGSIKESIKLNGSKSYLDAILQDEKGVYDSEVVALTSLCIAAESSAKVVRGSNPTWYRKAKDGEMDVVNSIMGPAQTTSEVIMSDLSDLQAYAIKRNIKIFNASVEDLTTELLGVRADFIITSPPYLTRLDYIIKHLPNLLVLSGFVPIDIEGARRRMIGTPKIVNKSPSEDKWGVTCNHILESIKSHESYASGSYYIWTYVQYFRSLFLFLERVKFVLSEEANGILVLQNNTYKDLFIPVSDITVEMLAYLGVESQVVRRESVKININNLGKGRKGKEGKKEHTEDVLIFSI